MPIRDQFIPHMPGFPQGRPDPGHIGASAFEDPPFACAAKVDSSCVKCFWPQDGHSISGTSDVRRTSFSKRDPQSSHLYS